MSLASKAKLLRSAVGVAGALGAARALVRWARREDLRGKTVLIMGGSRGLGLDMGRIFAKRGCQIALCARDPEEVELARAELAGRGATVLAGVCDSTDEQQVGRFVERTIARFGSVDVLVTNAATIQVGPVEVMTRKDFEDAMSSIFWATYIPTMAVLPHMRARRAGRIVHITSFGGKIAQPHLLPYCSAKFAATGFSEGLRAEVAKDGIRVTTITPGLLRTGAQVNVPFKGQLEKEYVFFSTLINLPFVSLPSERAAKRIVAATERGDAENGLSMAPRLLSIANAVSPGLVSWGMALANRYLLPSAEGGSTEAVRGADVAARSSSVIVKAVERLGRSNAEEHHAYPDLGPGV